MLCRSLRILKRRRRQQEAVSKQKKFPFDELHTICIKDVRRDILKHDTKLDVMEAVKVNAMENREVLCNRKKNLASQESFFSCVQNLQIALLAIMLQQGKDLAFFRNRETSKGGLQLLGLLMKTEFFNMRSCCNPMHFKTTFKNSRRSLFYQDFIFQLFEL